MLHPTLTCGVRVWPYQALIERQQMAALRQNIGNHYEQFTGRTLEQYFQAKMMESGHFTMAGNWWDRKGFNVIDLIALNEFENTGIVAEVKRNPRKINLSELEGKIKALPSDEFGKYKLSLCALSLEDM